MSHFTFDTSVVIAYDTSDLPKSFLLSAVVLTELMASAKNSSLRKEYEALWRAHERTGTLIVPDPEDWLFASRILFWLSRSRKKRSGGKLPRLPAGASQRLVMDALIAVSARRAGATLVTDNWSDFKAIQYYCGVKLRRGASFFS